MSRVGGPGFADMEWAHDGQSLFVVAGGAVARVDLASGRTRDIYRDPRPRTVVALAVSPDQRSLAITVTDNIVSSIEIVPAGGGVAREVFSATFPDAFLLQEWMHDGASVLITRGRNNGREVIRGDWSIWGVPVAGGPPRSLNVSAPRLRGVKVSSDGMHLAYRVGDPVPEYWLMRNFLP
jgi:hypothetical protein